MRGHVIPQDEFFNDVNLEDRIPSQHPLSEIKEMVDSTVKELSPTFNALSSATGRPSIPPMSLIKATLASHSVLDPERNSDHGTYGPRPARSMVCQSRGRRQDLDVRSASHESGATVMETSIRSWTTCLLTLLMILATVQVKAQTWEKMKMQLPGNYSLLERCAISFATKDIGWLTTTGNDPKTNKPTSFIFKTTDGGNNWLYMTENIGIPFVLDSNTMWANAANNILLKSSNGGNTWDSLQQQNTFGTLYFFDEDHGVAFGRPLDNTSWTTSDGGRSWSTGDSVTHFICLNDICFVNKNSGWFVGDCPPTGADAGMIAHTSDGGSRWEYQEYSPNYTPWLYGVDFIDSLHGFASGPAHILHTTDAGKSWRNQTIMVDGKDVAFVTSTIGFITGKAGIILSTKDAGMTWRITNTGTDADFMKLAAVKRDRYIYAIGKNTARQFILVRSDVSEILNYNEHAESGPTNLEIGGAFPNPFNESATITLKSNVSASVEIVVRSVLAGEIYRTTYDLIQGEVCSWTLKPRDYQQTAASGLYIVTARLKNEQKHMILNYVK